MPRQLVLVLAPVLLIIVGCSAGACAGTDGSGADPGADLGIDTGADVIADVFADADDADTATPDAAEVPLRPNVQDGVAPNASGQTPAFPEQTRAPQPAEPTAFTTEVVATGLGIPWGMAQLPDGDLLVTDRAGSLRRVSLTGTVSEPIAGVPEVAAVGQGGLLDVAVGPTFAGDRAVFLTYAEDRGSGTTAPTVARGTLSEDGSALTDVTVLYRQEPARTQQQHYGSRIVFDDEGALFVTFGDRGGAFEDAQSPFNGIGAVIRIAPNGSIPSGNPFADGQQGDPAVWSWGHRNIQSATLGPDGALWTVEHGPRGGDELNRPEAGVNHGWPVITYGINYSGQPIGDGLTAQEGMAQQVYYWDPVIAPSDMATYTGDLFEGWEGDLLIGGLQAQAVVRLSMRDGRVYTEEWLRIGARVRSVEVAADGAVLVGTDAGELLRLRPE